MDAVSYSLASKQAQRIEKFIENPDSTSGVVTVPSTIATGETITIPTGRTAILPDVVVEGDLLVEGTVFIPTGSTYTQETIKTEAISNVAGSTAVNVTDIVSKVGNQTIAGTKTFSTSPTAPTPTAGDNSTKVATTAFCTSQDIGVGQTWQNVVGSRGYNQIYTNSTGKPIFVMLVITTLAGTAASLQIETSPSSGVYEAVAGDSGSANITTNLVGIVPNLCRYKVVTVNTPTLNSWKELR